MGTLVVFVVGGVGRLKEGILGTVGEGRGRAEESSFRGARGCWVRLSHGVQKVSRGSFFDAVSTWHVYLKTKPELNKDTNTYNLIKIV